MEINIIINDLDFTVKFTAYKAERPTWSYPGCPAHLDYTITHICGMEFDKMVEVFGYDNPATLNDWIIDKHPKGREGFEKEVEDACWDEIRQNHAA